jgi:hypothetical protein
VDAENCTEEAKSRLPAPDAVPTGSRIGFWLFFVACVGAWFLAGNPWAKAALVACVAWCVVRIVYEILILGGAAISERVRWAYERGDGGSSLILPNAAIQGQDVRRLLHHPDLASKRAPGLRQLIYWWQVPTTDCHQEIMEQGEVYRQLRPVTARLLAQHEERVEGLLQRCIREALERDSQSGRAWSVTRVRNIVGPMLLPFMYEFALGRHCPPEVLRDLMAITSNLSANVASVARRNLSVRLRTLEHLREVLKLEHGRPDMFGDTCPLTIDQRAQYLLGVWMQTGAAQLLRMTANALVLLARHPRCVAAILEERNQPGPYTEAVLNETLRLTPGTRLTNRFAIADIDFNGVRIERGTNVLFAFKSYQRTGFERPDEFIPERWREVVRNDASFVPFGIGSRRCPAERLTFKVVTAVVHGVLAAREIRVPPARMTVLPRPPQFRVDDACCIVRGTPPGCVAGWLIDQRLRAAAAMNELRRAILPAFMMPRDAREAFADYPVAASGNHKALS